MFKSFNSFIGFVIILIFLYCVFNKQKIDTDTFSFGNSYTNKVKKNHSQEAIDYYDEIVMGSEFGGRRSKPHRWTEDVKIYVNGDMPDHMYDELLKVVDELNELIDPISLYIVNKKSDANLIMFPGTRNSFLNQNPNVNRNIVENAWGYFLIGENEGIIYVETFETEGRPVVQKSIIREELTQSLGLMNDSYTYPESIFYQKSNQSTSYTDLDKEIIQMLYNE